MSHRSRTEDLLLSYFTVVLQMMTLQPITMGLLLAWDSSQSQDQAHGNVDISSMVENSDGSCAITLILTTDETSSKDYKIRVKFVSNVEIRNKVSTFVNQKRSALFLYSVMPHHNRTIIVVI